VRILQLTSDWKWTGPAAPMLELSLALRARGHEIWLACPPEPPGSDGALMSRARARGLEPALQLERGRGVRWGRDGADARRLRALVLAHGVEIVHAWHTRDHALALRAAAGLRASVKIVRSFKSADPIPAWPWNRWLFGTGCDGLLCVSPGAARVNARLRGGRPVAGAFGAVDLARFAPGPAPDALRRELRIAPGQRVIGIVARAQRHRRFDLLLEAMRELSESDRDARLLVIGRGTHIEETAREPARKLGISDRVVFAGYRGEDYPDVLRLCDVFTLLVPGSDGGCRALLEASACGLPAVTTRRGALPELVVQGETGLIVGESPEELAAAWRALLESSERRQRMGAAARARAERHFTPARLASAVEALYRDALR
jgi:glycosyltransferase involved in cell wall biosynthesis